MDDQAVLTPQAGFIIRPDGDRSKCIIGVNLTGSTLKPNTVYEIVEIMGDYMIREVGAPAMPKGAWGYTVGDIMESFGGTHLMTEEEYRGLKEYQRNKENQDTPGGGTSAV